jgi:hypothetical protein
MTLRLAAPLALLTALVALGCQQQSNAKSLDATNQRQSGGVATAETKELFYTGEDRVLSLVDGTRKSETLLVLKRMEPAKGLMTELACVKEADGTARISPVYMRVDVEKGSMLISGSPDFSPDSFLTGTATMQGEPWNWNVLRFDMQFKTPRGAVTIKDSNWVVGNLLVARKEILAPNGTPVQLWEVEAQAVTQAEFEAKRISAGCPAFE